MLKNNDIELLKRISKLLTENKLRIFNSFNEVENGQVEQIDPYTRISVKDLDLFNDLIEREIKAKKDASIKAATFNKDHREQHNASNRNCPYYKKKHKPRKAKSDSEDESKE